MKEPKFKFTQEDLDNMVLGALGAEGGETPTKTPGKPNILQLLRGKKELNNQGKWPLV